MACKPIPASKVNPAVPPNFDRVLARCLAKDPAERYANGDELARDLYPFARRTPATSPAPARRKRSWRPLLQRAAWATAALAVVSVSIIPAAVMLASRATPPPPMFRVAAPKPPANLLTGSLQDTVELSALASKESAKTIAPKRAVRRLAPHSLNLSPQPLAINASSLAADLPQPKFPLLPPRDVPSETSLAQSSRAPLQIEITPVTGGETIAVYADRELLFTAPLLAGSAPIQVDRKLLIGPHQFRVALYRSDKSLQTEKEGLAEIRGDSENRLVIKVTRKSKFLIRREASLEVSWPTAVSHTSATSAALK